LVSTVTPAIVAVFTVPVVAAAALLALLAEGEGEGEAPAELHPTRAATAAAAAGSARSIRRRAGPLLIRRALPLPPRPEIHRVVMTSCPFSWQLAPKGGHASFADAQEYGREYRPPNV
jgi:hypothetical protein